MRSSTRYCVALALGLAPVLLPSAGLAQTQLPPIYVQGTTLEAPRPPASKGKPRRAGRGGDQGRRQGRTATPRASLRRASATPSRSSPARTCSASRCARWQTPCAACPASPSAAPARYGNFTQVRIRGAEGNHTLVLIDGVEANNTTDGELDFSNLSAEDIERIEVIRGPMSALYGSNAVGGVINIITRRGQGPLTLTLKTEAGSLGTSDVAARLSAASQWAHFAARHALAQHRRLQHLALRQRGRRHAAAQLQLHGRREAHGGPDARSHPAPGRQEGRPRRVRRPAVAGRLPRRRRWTPPPSCTTSSCWRACGCSGTRWTTSSPTSSTSSTTAPPSPTRICRPALLALRLPVLLQQPRRAHDLRLSRHLPLRDAGLAAQSTRSAA